MKKREPVAVIKWTRGTCTDLFEYWQSGKWMVSKLLQGFSNVFVWQVRHGDSPCRENFVDFVSTKEEAFAVVDSLLLSEAHR